MEPFRPAHSGTDRSWGHPGNWPTGTLRAGRAGLESVHALLSVPRARSAVAGFLREQLVRLALPPHGPSGEPMPKPGQGAPKAVPTGIPPSTPATPSNPSADASVSTT